MRVVPAEAAFQALGAINVVVIEEGEQPPEFISIIGLAGKAKAFYTGEDNWPRYVVRFPGREAQGYSGVELKEVL